jgi:hypothetical protein
MKRIAWFFVLALVLALSFRPVLAEEKGSGDPTGGPWKRLQFRVGGYLAALNSDVTFGLGNLGTGIVVNVEDALGLDSSTAVFRGDFRYRFGSTRRHNFLFDYMGFRRDGSKVLGADIDIGDETITVGTTIETEFNFDIFQVGYSYSFLKDDRIDLGVGGGVYVMPIDFSFTAGGKGLVVDESITAPLPVLKLTGDFALTPKWFLKASMDIFYLKIGDFEGSIFDSTVAVEYNAWKHVGFGLALDFFRAQVKAEDDDAYPGIDFVGNIDFGVSGLMLYAKVYW